MFKICILVQSGNKATSKFDRDDYFLTFIGRIIILF